MTNTTMSDEPISQLSVIRDGDDCLVDDIKRGQLYIRHPMDRFPEIVMAGKISLPNKWRKYRPVSATDYVSACCPLGVTVTPVRLEPAP